MQLTSPAFPGGESIPAKYTCEGDNVSPPLNVSGVPDGAQSLALIMDDPDAPSGTWIHWTVWNIPPETKTMSEGRAPAGAVEGATDREAEYHGPCPPSGSHRYFFRLYALDTKISLWPEATRGELGRAMEGHILDKTEFMGIYQKKGA